MDVIDWQTHRIRHSRYQQDGMVKPWPCGINVQILGAAGSGRRSLLKRICQDEFSDKPSAPPAVAGACDMTYKQTEVRGLPCGVWFAAPLSLSAHGRGHALASPHELFLWLARSLRDCDAVILAYDAADPASFAALHDFCARCERAGLGVGPGTALPCVVVGTKADRPETPVAVAEGWRLARRLRGGYATASALTGRGVAALVEAVVTPVVDARVRLMRESEEVLGRAVRGIIAGTERRASGGLPRLIAASRRGRSGGGGGGWDAVNSNSNSNSNGAVKRPGSRARARCTGAPPRWTMRNVARLPPLWHAQFQKPQEPGAEGDGGSDGKRTVVVRTPCPPEFQLSLDLVEPADTDWRVSLDALMLRHDAVPAAE